MNDLGRGVARISAATLGASTRRLFGIPINAMTMEQVSLLVEDAVARIGLKQTAEYVLAVTTASMFNAEAPLFEALLQRLWRHSLTCALMAKALARRLGSIDPELLFMMGLLHDIGKLLLLKVLMELPRTRNLEDERQINDVLDTLHGEFGSALLHRWHFDDEFVAVAKLHHDDENLTQHPVEVQVIALANQLSDAVGDAAVTQDCTIARLSRSLGVALDELPVISAEAREQFDEMQAVG